MSWDQWNHLLCDIENNIFQVMINYLKENNKLDKYDISEAIYSQSFKNCCTEEEIDEYIETRKLTKYFNNSQ